MSEMTMVQALNAALRTEMRANDRIVVLGEDVGRLGGVFRVTDGLYDEFGKDRVLDTPLSEVGVIGSAIGMALYGLRPVAEIQFADFVYPAFDQIVNELAKYRYRSGGQFACPVVVRMPSAGGVKGGHCHSQSPESYFVHTAGLKVVMPSNPYDAKGLLTAAIRDDDPVIFFEPKTLYRAARMEVPDSGFTVPIGKASTLREGGDVSVLSYGAMAPLVLRAANRLAGEGIDCEVIDVRTLLPLDIGHIAGSISKTSRAVIVHEAPRTGGFGAELMAQIVEHAFWDLDAPIVRVTGYDTPFPYALEDFYMPTEERVIDAVRHVVAL
ncbi:MAG: alpha-ketoacid dehydrogenase subunit beta [Acidobacteria bacterium]|nr:alpha-ketoacid dehydrogenase subunit beta [Acidobacteriota bacterium]